MALTPRLKVPKIRALMEYVNFVILFVLYIVAIEGLEADHITGWEAIFMIYAVAFSVDKLAATRKHGMRGGFRQVVGSNPSVHQFARQRL